MNVPSIGFEGIETLVDAPPSFVLVAKWTVVLALAWLAHAALRRRNPRWRIAVWRGAVIGVALVAILSMAPPVVEYHVASQGQSVVAAVRRVPGAPVGAGRAVPESLSVRESSEAIDLAPASVPPVGMGAGTSPAAATPRPGLPPPVRVEATRPRWGARAGSWLGSIWLAGVLVLTARLIAGNVSLARLVRRSSGAADALVEECRKIAERLACRAPVRVRLTKEVATPSLAGLWRPVLLLPERACEDLGCDDLRAILAHELAHARNHDLAWNLAAHLAAMPLWFHPLAWRIRAAHGAACDAVCDAVASDLLGDVALYGRTLARLAVRAAGPLPAHGLAMARSSDVRRRLDALNRQVFRTPLSWRYLMPALFVGSMFLVLIGGFGFTRAEQAAPTSQASDTARPAGEQTEGKLALRAVSAATNQPIEGVSVSSNGSFGEKRLKGTVATGKDGTATIDYPAGSKVMMLEITATAPGHVPIYIRWDREFGKPVKIPAFQELRLERGTEIGGVVKDETGEPIAGATIYRYSPPTKYEGPPVGFMRKGPTTDHQGRWRMEDSPSNLAEVTVEAIHPDYQTGSAPASRNLDNVIVLKKGFSVRGRVVDAGGRPVQGAKGVIGRSYWDARTPTATTDARGEFVLERCAEGSTAVTVQAEGFAPQLREVRVDERLEPLVFRLEHGEVLRLRVIDVQGKPVAGAFVLGVTWRRYNTIALRAETGADGRFAWRSAPQDVVLYDIGKPGLMPRRNLPLIASEREQVITLNPRLVIAGRVTDAETGRPLPKGLIVQGVGFKGSDLISWSRGGATEVSGKYTASFDEPSDAMYVRVEALGHKPAVSRAFRPDEGLQSLDFALEPAETLSGIVLLPDGKPAEGVDVVFATGADRVLFVGGRLESRTIASRSRTGPDGRFAFTATKDRFVLIALSDSGYADASPEEFAKSDQLVLRPWGRLEGEVFAGRRPKANEAISFSPARPNRGIPNHVFTDQYETRTDDHGRFALDRVIPGPGLVSRVLVTNFGRFSQHMSCGGQAVDIRPNQTTKVRIGGRGRPVIGRVVLDGTPDAPIEWTQNPPAFMTRPKGKGDVTVADIVTMGSNFEEDGRLRFDDVTPGTYELGISIHAKPDPEVFAPREAIGSLRMSVTVPEVSGGQLDEPLDLGTVTVKVFETLKVGAFAPDFVVRRIAGKGKGDQLRLVDYRGRLVLIDFWATWWGPCLAEMPPLKDIQKSFGADPRFNLISLACDQTDEVAKRYIQENGLIWTHGLAGDLTMGVGLSYRVRSIPATFLIGPDGRILAKNLRRAELKEAVRRALENPELFPAATRPTQPSGSP